MSFVLTKAVNLPTTFLARFSELSDRFDPEMVLFRRKTHNFKYPVSRLREFFREPPQYGAGERGIERETIDQARYVRITDIDEYGILNDVLGATAAIIEPRYILEEDDLLLARSGNTVGKSYLHKTAHVSYPCFFAGYLIRFRFETNRILPDYVFVLTQLPYYKEWVQAVQRAAGQPNINAWEYSNLQIPIPPMRVQKTIIKQLKMAYDTKRTKERQAYNFLEKVDRLLLAELGIASKPAPPSTVENRIFKRPFSEVTGGRLDPLYHHGDIFAFVRAANFDLERLGNHVTTFLTGFAAGRNDQGNEENGIIQIRPTNISEDRELVFRRNVFIAPTELKKRPFDRLRRHELLFNNTNSQEQVGKTVYFDLEGDYFCSNHITRIATDGDRLDPKYLVYILNLYQRQKVFFKLCTNWNNQSGVGADVLSKITVPLPGLERQKQIVRRLDKIRSDAQELRRKAAVELKEAKKAIEAMILGRS